MRREGSTARGSTAGGGAGCAAGRASVLAATAGGLASVDGLAIWDGSCERMVQKITPARTRMAAAIRPPIQTSGERDEGPKVPVVGCGA